MHNSPAHETLHSNFGVSALSHLRMAIMEEVLFRETNNLFAYVAIIRFALFLQFPCKSA
jgi:hypothetical protein